MLPERSWIAFGHDGQRLVYKSRGPRAGLLRALGRKHADPIYRDRADGRPRSVGWVVAGVWWDVFQLVPLSECAHASAIGNADKRWTCQHCGSDVTALVEPKMVQAGSPDDPGR